MPVYNVWQLVRDNSQVKQLLGWTWHDLIPQTELRGKGTTHPLHIISSSMTSHKPPLTASMEVAHSNWHKRLGLAEWPKWQQSSWPWWRRPVEWFSLCPSGHRGLAEIGCFLRGHLAALCSYPSNAGIGISTWFRAGSVMESRKLAYEVLTYHMVHVIKECRCLQTYNNVQINMSISCIWVYHSISVTYSWVRDIKYCLLLTISHTLNELSV